MQLFRDIHFLIGHRSALCVDKVFVVVIDFKLRVLIERLVKDVVVVSEQISQQTVSEMFCVVGRKRLRNVHDAIVCEFNFLCALS